MPITNSAKKSLRRDRRRRERNLSIKNKMKREIKKFKELLDNKKDKKAKENLSEAYKAIDKAAKKNVISDNKAARKKSQLAKKVNN